METALVLLLSLFMLFSSVSFVISNSSFLECLLSQSNPSYPISEAIYTWDNTSFLSVLDAYARNPRCVSVKRPLAIVTAMHESHVQSTIACCKSHGLLLRTRSGGHDYEGLSYVSEELPFVILDMFHLRSAVIDSESETMWVESGAIIGEMYYWIAERSKTLAFPAGVCPTVGIGGHFSGGGYGNLIRKYGLSIDNIIDARIVDVNGNILDRKCMGEDLFWAIRGGGGASFGVVLSWKIRLVKVPEIVTVFKVERTLEEGATELIYQWQQIAPKMDKEIFLRLELHVVDGKKKTIRALFIGMFLGRTLELIPLMTKSFHSLGLRQEDYTEMSWIKSVFFWDEQPKEMPTSALLNRTWHESFMKGKSDIVNEPIPMASLRLIWKKMIELKKMYMQWNPYGGRMSEISESETPYPNRAGCLFKIQYVVYWKEEGNRAKNYHLNLARELQHFMTPYVSKSPRLHFLNYRDLDIGGSPYCNASYAEARSYGFKYFKGNFDRLVRVKTRVDPGNFFRNEQSIPPLVSKLDDGKNGK